MTPDYLPGDLVATTAIVTIYALVGSVALGAGLRLRGRDRAPTLLLAWAMLQHAVNELLGSPVPRALGLQVPALTWGAVVTGYFIAVPWALLFERMLGRGWRSSIRVTAIAYIVSAAGCTLVDVVTGSPGLASGFNRLVVAAGAAVAFGHLFAMERATAARLTVARVGILIFMALVVQDAFARAGMLPWRTESSAWAVLIGVGAIGYTVVTETMRRRGELHAVEQELATARRIQASLLPAAPPALDGAEVVFRYAPAAAVAGDIFDFVGAERRRVGILVADVSGHGVPAALIASMVKVAAAAQKGHADDPGQVLAGIHLTVAEELPPAHFVTAVYVHLDLDRRRLRYASAGHPLPVIWRAADGAILPDASTGPMIVSFAPPRYPVHEVPFAPGDRVLLYTDGVVEAMRTDDEMFGAERLREMVAASAGGPDRLVSDIIKAAAAFTGRRRDAGFDDDCTLVAAEISGDQAIGAGVARE